MGEVDGLGELSNRTRVIRERRAKVRGNDQLGTFNGRGGEAGVEGVCAGDRRASARGLGRMRRMFEEERQEGETHLDRVQTASHPSTPCCTNLPSPYVYATVKRRVSLRARWTDKRHAVVFATFLIRIPAFGALAL